MKTLQLDEIKIKSKYLRVNANTDDLQKSISAIGQINPLIVNSNNELIAGGRRYSALKKLGYQKVKVIVVNKNELEEELLSIDENLVRRALSDVEFDACLRRAKDIYEQLNPNAVRYEEEITELVDPTDRDKSFAEITSEKLGVSPRVIHKAIARDMRASAQIKNARRAGELGVSQTNHLIKLDKQQQNDILPYLDEVPSNKLGDIVGDVIEHGVRMAIEKASRITPMSNEFSKLKGSAKKLNALAIRILAERLPYDGDERQEVMGVIAELKKNLEELSRIYS